MQNNGIGPTVFTSTSAVEGLLDDLTVTPKLLTPHNYRTKNRYRVLMDKTHTVDPESATTDKVYSFSRNFKLRGAKIKYSSSAGSIAATSSRALYFLIFAGTSAVLDTTPNNVFRLWYTDA